jgi:diguanylate cyclase (GGDEF)-like protein
MNIEPTDHSRLRNRLITSLYSLYVIFFTSLFIARQFISNGDDHQYVAFTDTLWLVAVLLCYSAGLTSAIALDNPKSKCLIKTLAIVATAIPVSLTGAYSYGLETSTSILIGYSSIALVIAGYYYLAQISLIATFSAQVAIFLNTGELSINNMLVADEITQGSNTHLDHLGTPTIVPLFAHIIGPTCLGYILNYAINTFLVSIQKLVNEANEDILRLSDKTSRDPLTALKGRQSLFEDFPSLRATALDKKLHLFILMHDLDDLRAINQKHGHVAGDLAVVDLSQNIQASVDWQASFYRLGGDEFIGVHIIDRETNQFIDYLRSQETLKFITYGDNRITYKSSIGAYCDDQNEPISTLLAKADNALKRAKEANRDSFQELSSTQRFGEWNQKNIYKDIEGKTAINLTGECSEPSIEEGILNNEFNFYGQPIVNCKTNEIIGVEAIVRWDDLQHQTIPTEAYWETFNRLQWENPYFQIIHNARKAFVTQVRESLNVPAHFSIDLALSLEKATSSSIVYEEITTDDLFLDHCVLQIINSKFLPDSLYQHDKFSSIIAALENSRLKLALDDSGSEPISLSAIAKFDIGILKIGAELTRGLDRSVRKQEICSNLVDLSKKLNIELIAKDVTNSAQAKALQEIGIFLQQGSFWHEPKPTDKLEKM